MKFWISVILATVILGYVTVWAYGNCFYGWGLPEPLSKPVSLRDGSQRAQTHGHGYYFIGRSHYGGGYRGGK